MASSDVDPASGPSKSGYRQAVDDFCTFIYNGETGEVCGRTGKSWGKSPFIRLLLLSLDNYLLSILYSTPQG